MLKFVLESVANFMNFRTLYLYNWYQVEFEIPLDGVRSRDSLVMTSSRPLAIL